MTNIKCPHCDKDIELAVATPKVAFTTQKASEGVRGTASNLPLVNTDQAKQMRNKINIQGVIERKSEKRMINKKDGGTVETCDAYLTDEVGDVKIQFWGDEVNTIKDGMNIRIENGYTNSFKGEISLSKGKYGNMIIL